MKVLKFSLSARRVACLCVAALFIALAYNATPSVRLLSSLPESLNKSLWKRHDNSGLLLYFSSKGDIEFYSGNDHQKQSYGLHFSKIWQVKHGQGVEKYYFVADSLFSPIASFELRAYGYGIYENDGGTAGSVFWGHVRESTAPIQLMQR